MKKAIRDGAQVSVNKGLMFNKPLNDDSLWELRETVKDILLEFVDNGNLYEEYCIAADYRLRWRNPDGKSGHMCEIGIELTQGGKTIDSWDISDYLPRMTDYLIGIGYSKSIERLSIDIAVKVLSFDICLHTPKTISISEFCKQLTDCVYWDITPKDIKITDSGLTLVLPDCSRVDFVCCDGYAWSLRDGIDTYSFCDFAYYADGLDDIMAYLADNDFNLDEIDTTDNE